MPKLVKSPKKWLLILVLIFAWLQLHELLHALVVLVFGYSFTVKFGLVEQVICSCSGASYGQIATIASAPYFLDVAAMVLWFFRKGKWTFIIANIAFLDIILNYAASVFVALLKMKDGADFLVMALAGYNWLAVAIAAIGAVLAVMMHRKRVEKLFRKFKK